MITFIPQYMQHILTSNQPGWMKCSQNSKIWPLSEMFSLLYPQKSASRKKLGPSGIHLPSDSN